jgi:hypothetical protein
MRDAPVQRWTMENGWQLLWAGLYANGYAEYSLVQIPPAVRNTYVHHNHKISMFMQNVGDTPNGPTNRDNWGKGHSDGDIYQRFGVKIVTFDKIEDAKISHLPSGLSA